MATKSRLKLPGLLAVALLAGFVLPLAGCKQYAIKDEPTLRDPSGNAARLRTKPGLRAGMSEAAQDIERSVGY